MKTIYIPKGETVRYTDLYADRVVVDGCLKVEHCLDAKTIGGTGIIHAEKVSSHTIRIGTMEACKILCKRLLASRVDAPEVMASERIVVSCVLSAYTVKTQKLTVAVCDVEDLHVPDVEKVPAKRWSIFGILLFTWLQALCLKVRERLTSGEPIDADYEPVKEPAANGTAKQSEAETVMDGEAKPSEPIDEELNRIISLFQLTRAQGYTLRIIPGTPEENAPVFHFDSEQIIQPAA